MIEHLLTYGTAAKPYRRTILLPAPLRQGERVAFEDHVVEAIMVTHEVEPVTKNARAFTLNRVHVQGSQV